MKSTEFCYWLQGLFELANPVFLTAEQTKLIKQHLDMVFIHEIDKSYPEEQQAALDQAHSDIVNASPVPQRQPGMRC